MKTEERISISCTELVPVIREVLAKGGTFVLLVTGSSMLPLLKHLKSEVRLISPEVRLPKLYEIVFFMRDEKTYVLHRIVRCTEDGRFIINGDAQNWTETIDPEQIIGVVDQVKRSRRWISCDTAGYRIGVRLWVHLRPLRPIYFFIRRIAGKCLKILRFFISRKNRQIK